MKNTLNPQTAARSAFFPRALRMTSPVVGLTLLTLSLMACGSTSTPQTSAPVADSGTVAAPTAGTGVNPDVALVPYVYDGRNLTWEDTAGSDSLQTLALTSGNNDLSAQKYSSATNGWGPVEINKSNGESNAGDGNTLTLNGKIYASGLGVHSASVITYDLNGQCGGFQTDMGVDDEVRSLGSVTFEIWADGTKLYDSGLMTGSSATKSASVDLTGKKQLKLVVTNGGDNLNYDHADWAGATLTSCNLTSTAAATTTTTWKLVAPEFQSFTLPVRSTVRYGIDGKWVQKDLDAGTYNCGNTLFGDPAPGVAKRCEVSQTTTTTVPVADPNAFSGPLVITKGGTYSGNWESQDPRKAAVSVQTSEPVIIENSNIRGRGSLISGFGNRLTVRNVNGYGLNPNVVGWGTGKFVNAEDFISIRIENSYAENTQGVYFRNYKGNPANGDTVTVLRNKFKNINGLPSNGNEGYDLNQANSMAHMLQFNDVKRIPNVEIGWNEVINEPGKSQVEENINMYLSGGTPSSPILIHDNYIQGAYAAQPATQTGYAGGGIIVGDGVVSNVLDAGYTNVYNNQIVSTTNQGLAISGGVSNHFYNNRVIASGLLADGRRIVAQNVGMYMWDSNNTKNFTIPGFSDNSMNNNYIAWTKVAADGSTSTNPWWMPDCGVFGSTCSGNISGGKATLDTEKQEYQLWLSKLASNNIKIGKLN